MCNRSEIGAQIATVAYESGLCRHRTEAAQNSKDGPWLSDMTSSPRTQLFKLGSKFCSFAFTFPDILCFHYLSLFLVAKR